MTAWIVAGLALIPAAIVLFVRAFRRLCPPAPDPGPEVASLDCDGDCADLAPHEIDGALARCITCGSYRLVPLPLRAPTRRTHTKDQP